MIRNILILFFLTTAFGCRKDVPCTEKYGCTHFRSWVKGNIYAYNNLEPLFNKRIYTYDYPLNGKDTLVSDNNGNYLVEYNWPFQSPPYTNSTSISIRDTSYYGGTLINWDKLMPYDTITIDIPCYQTGYLMLNLNNSSSVEDQSLIILGSIRKQNHITDFFNIENNFIDTTLFFHLIPNTTFACIYYDSKDTLASSYVNPGDTLTIDIVL